VIKRYNSGKWFACVSVESNVPIEQKPIQKAVGLGVGLEHFTTDSDGKRAENLNCSRILVAEQNLGQLVHLVRESARCEVQLCPKIGGEVHKPREILARLEE
jgi:hypothetical protein